MKKILLLFFILMVGLCFQPIFAYSNNSGGYKTEIEELNDAIAEKKEKIKEIESSIGEYKKKISSTRLEAVSLENQMSIIDNRVAQVALDIEATEERLLSVELEIESLNLSIKSKEEIIEKQKVILSGLIRDMYQQDGKSYIEILATYNNFSDFYNQVQYLETIERDLGSNVKSIKLLKEDLEKKREQSEDRKKNYQELKIELEEKKQDLEEEKYLKDDLLARTYSSEQKYQTLLGNLKQQYQQIESEVSAIEQEVRKKLEAQNKLNSISGDPTKLSWPTQSRYITSYFHDPDYPYRHVFEHSGIDIRAAQGTTLKATASGYVARAKHCSYSSCYSYVMIVHSSGLSTVYGHMSGISVTDGQFVARGDIIGYSGGTPGTIGAGPFVTGPHLHFEVRKNGIPVNPLNYLIRDW